MPDSCDHSSTSFRYYREGLNRAAERASLLARFEPDGSARLRPGVTGVDGAIARILAIVFEAIIAGTWARLKACRWALYDASKNQSAAWC